jgi:hypothetical protein
LRLFQDGANGDSYISNYQAGSLIFAQNNTEQMRLTSTGLGIGTSSVGAKLQVSSGATALATYIASTATPTYSATSYNGANALLALISGGASGAFDGIRMSQGGASEALFGLVQEAGGAGAFVWQGYNGSAYAERMRLDSSGNLGIGTSSPTSKLDVAGTLRSTTQTAPASGAGIELFYDTGGAVGYLLAYDRTATAYKQMNLGASLYNFGILGSTVMTIAGATGGVGAVGIGYTSLTSVGDNGLAVLGNVGIGTSSPAYKLDVSTSGTTTIRSISTANGDIGRVLVASKTSGAVDVVGVFASEGNASDVSIGTTSNHPLVFLTNNGEKMRLDSSGNLGLGVAPSAWLAGSQAFQNGGGSVFQYDNARIFIGQNTYIDSAAADKFIGNGYATRYRQYAGTHAFYVSTVSNSSGAGAPQTLTQAMTLDASGNLVIGATSAAYRLDVRSGSTANTAGFSSTNSTAYTPSAYNGDKARIFIQGGGATGATLGIEFTAGGSNESYFGTVQEAGGAGAFVWQGYNGSAYAERARITSSGTLCVNTSNPAPGSGAIQVAPKNDVGFGADNASAYYSVANYYNGSFAGGLYVTTGATALITSSDYRLKNTIAPMTGALAKVAQLKPVTYKWNADGSDGEGFIAHELAQVFPKAVLGEKDDVDSNGNPKYQGVDKLFLVATLTAAIQEQQALIESLTTRLAALEAA